MKALKNILVGVVTALITLTLSYGGYTIYAANGDVETYDSFTNSVEPLFVIRISYHRNMNQFFNDKLEKLNEIMEEEDFFDNPDFNAPPQATPDNWQEYCTVSNVSSFCVSMQGLDLYIKYLETLEAKKAQGGDAFGIQPESDSNTLDRIASTFTAQNEEIEDEKRIAKEVLEATMAAYDEYRIAYPMHKKYEQIIENMIKYKNALKEVRKRVERFPEKFIDVTTAYCQ